MLASALSARPRLGQQLVDPGVVALHAEVAALDAQRLAHAEEGVEHQLLRHDAQRAARRGVVGHHVVAHHVARPLGGAGQAGQDRDERGLAGAVGAQQAEELAGLDVEAHAVQRLEGAAGAG
jgi:hypothetical protein